MMYGDCINFDLCDCGKFGHGMTQIGRCENCPYYESVRTMRIISQDGKINLPYDLTAIIVSENHIQAVFSGDTRKIPYLMASYSSKKSCVDVMSMLNDASLGIHAKSLVGDVTKIGMNEVIFRFPEDDEV